MSLARASRPHRGRRTRARAMHRVATPAREDVTRAEKYLYFFRDQRPQVLVSNPANRCCAVNCDDELSAAESADCNCKSIVTSSSF